MQNSEKLNEQYDNNYVKRSVAIQLTSKINTQSPSPALLVLGGVNWREPLFGKGDPAIALYAPFVGSYQRAVTLPANCAMSTVMVRTVGR